MKACIGMFACLLAGCATTPVATSTVEVRVPVPVPCLTNAPESPPSARKSLAASSDPAARLRAMLIDLARQDAYIPQLEAALSGCIAKP